MLDTEKISSSLEILIKSAKSKAEQSFRRLMEKGSEIQGHFTIETYERGKKVKSKCREEKNIWLLEGRAYSAMVKSYASYGPDLPIRNDKIKYIGVGSGTQPEVSTITRLVTPIPYNAGNDFLATLDIPTFSIDNTIVTYTRTFQNNEISVAGTVIVSELGLFTDGVLPNYTPGSRNITFPAATSQAPLSYKTFEPLPKTTDSTVSIKYSLRHN